MKLTLSPDAEQIIQEQLQTQRFSDPEAVVLAALKNFAATPPDEFEIGEMQSLLEEGEESIKREGTLDAEEAFISGRANRKVEPLGEFLRKSPLADSGIEIQRKEK